MTAAPKGLHAKLAEVMAEAERIPKNGTAPAAMGGYPFVQVGDAADFIRKALGTRGVSMLPTGVEIIGHFEHETRNGGTMTTVELRVTWTLTDGETKDSAVIQSYGVGADSGDKYSGKAMTNAMKYALLAGFQLSTGDDVEQSDTSDRRRRVPRAEDTAEDTGPTYVSLGTKAFTGKVAKGDGQFNDVAYHETPSGHMVGFRLELEGGSAIHEVLCNGAIGEALFLAVPAKELLGATVDVEGEAFRIDQQGRRARARLTVTRIKGPGFTIPAPEAPSEPMFTGLDAEDQESVDAALAAL